MKLGISESTYMIIFCEIAISFIKVVIFQLLDYVK